MKLLLLANCNNINTDNIEDCKNRNEIFTFLLKSYLIKMAINNNFEIEVMKCFPYLEYKKTKTILFPKVDHIIFIDEKGFYDKNLNFINYLHKFAKYTVSTICKNSKYLAGEDLMFNYIKCDIPDNKVVNVKPPCDKFLYDSRKEEDIIYILFNEPESPFDIIQPKITEKKQILSELKAIMEENPTTQFKFASINTKLIKFIDNDNNILEIKQFVSYTDYIYELSKANIYFMNDKCQDIYKLYELSMCDTLIVTNNKYISDTLKNELEIISFDKFIDWKIIFDKINNFSIRTKLIADYTWENLINIMLDNFRKHMSLYKNDIMDSQNILNKIHHASSNDKAKAEITTHIFLQPAYRNL
ncbi:hypothetical protein Klosneuvirus_1_292 [Klosneuvirus KNV1]|uniref:Uncharacterized protein n=1 Tax=Klosneuvirus KNV1 TaxID=1977640 RepID=A0A1V0SI90_9VIRU|nr:hypothetical protein Klosneuvirus_1_292 [Klosneuvirus KNV1]